MKKIIITLIVLFGSILYSQPNPYSVTRWVKTTQDTIRLSYFKSDIKLSIEVLGFANDTVFIKTQRIDTLFNSEYFICKNNFSVNYTGTKFILKSNRDSVLVKYFIGNVDYKNGYSIDLSVDVFKDTLKTGVTRKTYSITAPHNYLTIRTDSAWYGDSIKVNFIHSGDTTQVYFYDSANTRVPVLICSGDLKKKEYRIDEIPTGGSLEVVFMNTNIFTNRVYFKIRGVRY